MKILKMAAVVFLALNSFISNASAGCWVIGNDLCAVSCRGESDKITSDRVKEASVDDKVCALSIAENSEIFELLLTKGVDINVKTEVSYKHAPAGRNALFRVIEDGRTDLFDALLKHNVDVNVHDRHGTTPLMEAVWYNSAEQVNRLLVAGALPNVQDIFGKSALCYAQEGFLLQPPNPEVIDILEKAGAICLH